MKNAPPRSQGTARQAEIRRFIRARYGLAGTFALHREALGWDLMRAPLNVALSPIFLLTRLIGLLLIAIGQGRAGRWLNGRQIFLASDVGRRIEADLAAFMLRLDRKGLGPAAPPDTIRHEIAAYAETRNAVADIATSILVLITGFLLFHRATPGVISLTAPLAEMQAHSTAVQDFLLGQRMGRVWYWAFPVDLAVWQVIATGVVLSMGAALVTTFSGLIADPVQLILGMHQRRLARLLKRLDNPQASPSSGLAREHVLARLGDLSDAALSLMRIWR
ncbi:MAG: DUF6635 family protein [Paracoccus sp. (in: a-proteobacteria)]